MKCSTVSHCQVFEPTNLLNLFGLATPTPHKSNREDETSQSHGLREVAMVQVSTLSPDLRRHRRP